MDVWEAAKVVFERVRALDPGNASKMMGMLLIQDNSDRELVRLALGPDHLLHAFVATARAELAAVKPASPPSPPVLASPFAAGQVATSTTAATRSTPRTTTTAAGRRRAAATTAEASR
ncbi:unnamed protein product [Urochloa humidicola]